MAWQVSGVHDDAPHHTPHTIQEAVAALHALVVPIEVTLWRGGEEDEQPRRIGPICANHLVWVDDIAFGFGHLLHAANGHYPAALHARAISRLGGEEPFMLR